MNYQESLDRAGYAVRDKVGKVLSSGAEIMSLRDRASQFRSTKNPDVNARAEAVIAKANGLLGNYKTLEAESIMLLGEANAMRSRMDTDPLWQSILKGDTSVLGWSVLARAKDYIGEATSLTQRLASAAGRADDHLKAVGQLKKDEGSLEDFAQGKGFSLNLGKLGGFAAEGLSTIKIAAVGVIAFVAWDALRPFLRRVR